MSQANSRNSDWTKLLSDAIKAKENKPTGLGWKTKNELQAELGISHKRATLLVSSGVETFRGQQLVNGVLRYAVWYRPIKK